MPTREEETFKIAIAAHMAGTTVQTLRLYERHGLLPPRRKYRARTYNAGEIRWVLCLRQLIHEKKYSIAAVRKLLVYAPCWELRNCPPEWRQKCGNTGDRLPAARLCRPASARPYPAVLSGLQETRA